MTAQHHPRIQYADLTEGERVLVDSLLAGQEFNGGTVIWRINSKKYSFTVPSLSAGSSPERRVLEEKIERNSEHTSNQFHSHEGGTPIRARVLEDVILSHYGPLPRPLVLLSSIHVADPIDLSYLEALPTIHIANSYIAGLTLAHSSMQSFAAKECYFGYFDAACIRTRSDLYLRKCVLKGRFNCSGAEIGAQFSLSQSICLGELQALHCRVAESMFFTDGFEGHNLVNITGSSTGLELSFQGAQLLQSENECLSASNIKVGRNLVFSDGFRANGPISLNGAWIGGQLNFAGALLFDKSDYCLRALELKVDTSIFISDGFVACGNVYIQGSIIKGDLAFRGAAFLSRDESCLRASNLTVNGNSYFDGHFFASGLVDINGSIFHGNLSFNNARFELFPGTSLRADRIKLDGLLQFDAKSQICGTALFWGSSFASAVELHGNILRCELKEAEFTGSLRILSRSVLHVGLRGAKISLYDDQVALEHGPFQSGAINRIGTTIRNIIRPLVFRSGPLFGTYLWFVSKVPQKFDASINNVTEPFYLRTYELAGCSISDASPEFMNSVKQQRRITEKDRALGYWLERSDSGEVHPQTYRCFASLLHNQGRVEAADFILILGERRRTRQLPFFRRNTERLFLDLLAAYGFRPLQTVGFLFGFLLTCILVSSYGYSVGGFKLKGQDTLYANSVYGSVMPTDPNLHVLGLKQLSKSEVSDNSQVEMPKFYPIAYAFEVLVPGIGFGQKENWEVDSTNSTSDVLRYLLWFHTVVGWILTTLFLGSLAGIIRKRN